MPPPVFRATLASRLEAFPPVARRLQRWLRALGAPARALRDITLIIDELFTNSVCHGYQGRADGWVQLRVWRQGMRLRLQLRDGAPAFDPCDLTGPDIALPLDQRRPGGLGLVFIRRLSDEMRYQRLPTAQFRGARGGLLGTTRGTQVRAPETGINELNLAYDLSRARH
jgi:serine/threonine-protein kinase RsbW